MLTRVLADHNELHTRVGHIGIGWLVVEDLFTVVILVLLPALFGNRATGPGGLPLALALTGPEDRPAGGRRLRRRRAGNPVAPRRAAASKSRGGIARAAAWVLSASGVKRPQEVVRLARELNPGVRVLARSAYLRERADLPTAGANVVFSSEGEVALTMTETVLRELGASLEQIDRERDRADLFGDTADESRDAPGADADPPEPLPGGADPGVGKRASPGRR